MRLVTRADLDGLTCAVLITSSEPIESIELIHPQDITDKRIDITGRDILANVPYHPSCGKWFDHHELTSSNERPPADFDGRYSLAPSAARNVLDYYGPEKLARYRDLVDETDRLDGALLELGDIVNPRGWILLGYTLDSRTGLGAFKDYFLKLLELIKTRPLSEILEEPEVRGRIERVLSENAAYQGLVERTSRLDGNVVVTDLRDEPPPYPAGNRFLIYTLFPECNVSLRLHWGPERKFLVAALGHNILNRNCRTNIGQLCSRYGGGGHKGAGTAPLSPATAEHDIAEILRILKENG
jgi:hypothetical protein